jgi:hypothetical protein
MKRIVGKVKLLQLHRHILQHIAYVLTKAVVAYVSNQESLVRLFEELICTQQNR